MRGLVLGAVTVVVAAVMLLWFAQANDDPSSPDRHSAKRAELATTTIAPSIDVEADERVTATEPKTTSTLTVKVVDRDRRPLANASVTITGSATDEHVRALKTDSNGVARATGLVRGAASVMIGRGLGARWPIHDEAIDMDGRDKTVEIALDKRAGQSLTVLVKDDRGAPYAGVAIELGAGMNSDATTGADGRATFHDLLEGTYRVHLRDRRRGARRRDGVVEPEEAFGERPADIRTSIDVATGTTGVFTLPRRGSIEGTVPGFDLATANVFVERTDDPAAIDLITVANSSPRTFTASVAPGTYRVVADMNQTFAAASTIVKAGETVHVQLAPVETATLMITALQFPEQQPQARASCSAGMASGISDDRGEVTLRGVLPGRLEVECHTVWEPVDCNGSRTIDALPGTTTNVHVPVIAHGSIGKLGARVVASSDPSILMFAEVAPDGPAARAGIGEGDLLMTVGGTPATGDAAPTAATYMTTRSPGEVVDVGVRARGAVYVVNLSIKIGRS